MRHISGFKGSGWRVQGCRLLLALVSMSCLLGWLWMPHAHSQPREWPQRNVVLVLPFGPGSGTDVAARLLGEHLTPLWGRRVIVDNRPGGDSLIAINAFLSADDDHVLLFASSATFLAHPYMHEKLPYSFQRDFMPIAKISDTVLVAAVPAASKLTTISEALAQARAEPEKFNVAGAPGLPEFALDALLKTDRLNCVRIPYRDVVQSVRDLGENRIQFLLTSLAVVRPMADAGKVRILAAGTGERTPLTQDIPSIAESGYPILAAATSIGLFGPKRMSQDLRRRIAEDVVAVVSDTGVAAKIAATSQDPRPGGPEELIATLDRQGVYTAEIAKILGMERKQ